MAISNRLQPIFMLSSTVPLVREKEDAQCLQRQRFWVRMS